MAESTLFKGIKKVEDAGITNAKSGFYGDDGDGREPDRD
jgi:hypothetical protein